MNGLEALKAILDGYTVEAYDRYYRYDSISNSVQYSDYMSNRWQDSQAGLNEFIATTQKIYTVVR